MKVGELVIYIEGTDQRTGQPREYNALVLGERYISEHTGEDGEPLLTLAFAKERTDAAGIPLPVHGTGQTGELVQIRLDVAHESHEYTEEQQRFYGKIAYDGGRWKELLTLPAQSPAAPQLVTSAGPFVSGRGTRQPGETLTREYRPGGKDSPNPPQQFGTVDGPDLTGGTGTLADDNRYIDSAHVPLSPADGPSLVGGPVDAVATLGGPNSTDKRRLSDLTRPETPAEETARKAREQALDDANKVQP